MNALLRLHFQKMVGYRTFWVLLLGLTASLLLVVYVVAQAMQNNLVQEASMLQRVLAFPDIWQCLATLTRIGNYFFALLMILLVCNDFETKMLRQHVIDGLSREQVVAGYLGLAAFFALFSLGLLVGLVLLFGQRVEGQSLVTAATATLLGAYTLQSFATFVFAMMLAVLLTRAVSATMLMMLWLFPLEPIFAGVVSHKWGDSWSQLFPFQTLGKLVPLPEFLSPSLVGTLGDPKVIGLSCAYTAVFGLVAWARLRWSDL